MSTAAKICSVCAVDVSQKKRIKDSQGRYFCEACHRNSRTAAAAAPRAAATQAVASPISVADDDGLIGLADDLKPRAPVAAAAMFGCADCKKLVSEKQIRNDDGEFICPSCFAKRRSRKSPAEKITKSSFVATERDGDDHPETWIHTLPGGLTISAGVIVIGFFAYFVLNLYAPVAKHAIAPTTLLCGILAAIETVFVVLRGGVLLVSMVIAARIVGGIDFGYIGSAIWKSLAFVLVLGLFNTFADRSETFAMVGFGLRGVLLLLAFALVFRLDFFEAIILTIINFLLFMALAFGMAMLLNSVSHSFNGPSKFDSNDDAPPALHDPGPPANPAMPH